MITEISMSIRERIRTVLVALQASSQPSTGPNQQPRVALRHTHGGKLRGV